jgi:hypothetical protein
MILLGKSRDEVIETFCENNKIEQWKMETFLKGMKRNIYISSDTIAIILGILFILFGAALLIAIIGVLAKHEGLLVFAQPHGILQRFTNMFTIFIEFSLPLFLMAFPWIWWARRFDW